MYILSSDAFCGLIYVSQGVDTLLRIPPSVLKQHNKRDDAWSSFNGKVYNMTSYMAFHPGGEKELLRVAGRDGTKLFGMSYSKMVSCIELNPY
jgi:cytochrome b involved in lipid metabolism